MSKKGITLSPKHGVNPAMEICFFCGKDSGSILLLGKLPGDAEAPRRCHATYNPCDTCSARMAEGIALAEVSQQPNAEGQPPISTIGGIDLYPTGRWCVISREGARAVLTDEAAASAIDHGRALIDAPAYQALMRLLDSTVAPPAGGVVAEAE